MSLSLRRQLNNVHPWVADRVRYILDYADHWGPAYSITSGVRTAQDQWDLFDRPNSRAVQVGCSQHQYGLAIDVWFEDPAWQQWYLSSARNFGLTTLPFDPVHVQAVPGGHFREAAQSYGLCPDPRYPLSPTHVSARYMVQQFLLNPSIETLYPSDDPLIYPVIQE